jgi:cobalt-zinc-cadmium efflux system protein
LGRVEPLAALINSVTLVLAGCWIIYEATTRLLAPVPVNGSGVMIIAFGGLLANGVATWILMRADQTNLNVRAAMMHSLIDAISSVGVLIAGLVIALTGWNAIDPLTSYLIAAMAIFGTWGILRRSLDLVLDASPESTDINAVAKDILEHPATTQVHDVHVWSIGSNRNAMTAHVLIDPTADIGAVLDELEASIRAHHSIEHVTLQVAPDRSRMLHEVQPKLSHPRARPPHGPH